MRSQHVRVRKPRQKSFQFDVQIVLERKCDGVVLR